jgi:ABC-type bacteriocin/lantibiotic exporter with double-glycine peptidase domain
VRADGCGAAALCAVLERRGLRVSQDLVWSMCRLPSGGTTLARLTRAARCLGQPAEARAGVELEALPLPAVVHLRRRHFVVLLDHGRGRAVVRDPACGDVAVPLERLRAEASGAALVLARRAGASSGTRIASRPGGTR